MWVVIKVDNQEDIGTDEKERYLVQGDKFEMEDVLKSINLVDIHYRCVKVHPATEE